MNLSVSSSGETLNRRLLEQGFCFVAGASMRALLAQKGKLGDWNVFAASWNDLPEDRYLLDQGRYRRRRHAVFSASRGGAMLPAPHQPHFQSREYNALQGGIERWFEPIVPAIAAGESLASILAFCLERFSALAPAVDEWHVEVHQFRIEAHAGQLGQPTPEGVHRDGVDYVLVLLIDRRNIASGTTTIHAVADRRLLGSFTLTATFDSALVDDARVFHGVTPVESLDPALSAYRDVLVVTFKRRN